MAESITARSAGDPCRTSLSLPRPPWESPPLSTATPLQGRSLVPSSGIGSLTTRHDVGPPRLKPALDVGKLHAEPLRARARVAVGCRSEARQFLPGRLPIVPMAAGVCVCACDPGARSGTG